MMENLQSLLQNLHPTDKEAFKLYTDILGWMGYYNQKDKRDQKDKCKQALKILGSGYKIYNSKYYKQFECNGIPYYISYCEKRGFDIETLEEHVKYSEEIVKDAYKKIFKTEVKSFK